MKKSEEDRLKCVVYENTRAPLRGPPSPMGKAAIRGYCFSRHNAFPQWGRQRGGGFAAQKRKPTPPRYARQPLPREGARVDAPSLGRRCPEGAEVEWGKRDEKDRERSSQVRRLREHPSAAARSPFPKGEGYDTRMPLFSHCQSEYTHMWKKE